MKHSFLFNKTYHEWPKAFISEPELRKLANIGPDQQIFLKTQGGDELITSKDQVDLAREGIEQLYSVKKEKYQFIINDKLFVSHEPIISEAELRTIGKLTAAETLFFKVEGPDREIFKGQVIDLKPYPIEEFYSVSAKLVHITINRKSYEIKPGKYSVAELKKIGGVNPAHDLDQLIGHELVPLDDNGFVVIKGCEEFKSHPKDGQSS